MLTNTFSRRAVLALATAAVAAAVQAQTVVVPVKLAMIESLSGPFANTGEAVVRNIAWAEELPCSTTWAPSSMAERSADRASSFWPLLS